MHGLSVGRAWTVAAVSVLLLGACATENREERAVDDELVGAPGCFYARDVQDFRVIDRSRLIVLAPNDSRAFQLRISPPSSALRNATRLRFESRGGQICGRAGESIYFDSQNSLRYVVMDVRRLDQVSVDLLRGNGGPAAAGLEAQNETEAEIEPLAGEGGDNSNDKQEAGEP